MDRRSVDRAPRYASAGLLGAAGIGLGLALAAGGLAPAAAHAQSLVQQVTWAHPAPARVDHFLLYVSPEPESESRARVIDVGKPESQPMGSGPLYVFSAYVEGTNDEFVAVAAVGRDGVRTPLSEWSGLPPSAPGQPILIGP